MEQPINSWRIGEFLCLHGDPYDVIVRCHEMIAEKSWRIITLIYFYKLPIELRLNIWGLYCPELSGSM